MRRKKNCKYLLKIPIVVVVQLLSHVWLFAAPWTAACQASLSFTISWRLLKLMFIQLVTPSNHLIFCRPLLLPSVFPRIRLFSKESALWFRCPKHWSFRIGISPSNEYSGLISFRIDLLDLLTVQGTLNSSPTPQFQRTSSSVLSLLYSPTLTSVYDYWKKKKKKNTALTILTFVGKIMYLLLNMLSRFLKTFLPKRKCILISWLCHSLQWFWSPRK